MKNKGKFVYGATFACYCSFCGKPIVGSFGDIYKQIRGENDDIQLLLDCPHCEKEIELVC